MDNSNTWLAAYLYYSEPWEGLLSNAVKPFVEDTFKNDLAEQFFFIRYWEKGPHIRLRFKGSEQQLAALKPKLTAHFEQYYKDFPSDRDDNEYIRNLPEEHKWFPNNSTQFIPYEPEVDRYGGARSILIAEEQFEASSKAILDVISESDEWGYDRALGVAIQMHLGFAYALGMELAETSAFFGQVFENWLPRAYYSYEQGVTPEEMEKRKVATLEAFRENFDNQKEVLLPYFETVWQAFIDGEEFEQAWLNTWLSDMAVIKEKLLEAQQAKQLTPPDWYPINPSKGFTIENIQRWSIYDSYVHMINNRLGIMNRDEGYLGYLIKESLNSITNQSIHNE
ncbi:MAG: thiopeptide-type bacteriocin biosynthesis protein [Bacteroidota bacterium]